MKKKTKKILFTALLMLAFVPMTSKAQYTITGYAEGLPDGLMYVERQGQKVDSTAIDKGSFIIKGMPLDAPDYCNLMSKDHKFAYHLWIDNGDDIKLTAKMSNGEIHITGAKVEDEYQLYKKYMQPMWNKEQALKNKAMAVLKQGHRDQYDALEAEFETKLKVEEDNLFMEFAKQYPSSYICLNHVYNCRGWSKYEFPRYDAMYKLLTPNAFKGRQWNAFMEIYNKDKNLQPGCNMPDISLSDVFGVTVSLSKYRGKYVLFTIGSAPLADYKAMLPIKEELYKKYGSAKLEIVDMMVEKDKDALLKVMANNNVAWTLLSDYKSWHSPILTMLGIDHICQNFLIDPQGKIIARNIFGNDLKDKVETMLH